MNVFESLKDFGLRGSEAQVYVFLLTEGYSTPPQVSKGTRIARAHCYGLLRKLKEMGLIEEQTRGKRKAYIATDPEALVRMLEQKKNHLTQALPDLRCLYSAQQNKPKISFYENNEQIQEIFRQTLAAKEIYGIGSTKEFKEAMPTFFVWYQNQLQKKKIVFQDILTTASKSIGDQIKEILRGSYDVVYLPEKHSDVPTNILVWDGNIALIDFGHPAFGTVLTNASLAQTFRILCRTLQTCLKDER